MEETAAEVRARLVAAATQESPESVELFAKLPETHLPLAALIAREVALQHWALRGQPWSPGFLLGRTTPHYFRIVEALKHPEALDRGSLFIAGFHSLVRRQAVVILIKNLLLGGAIVSVILALLFRVSWLPVAVVCLVLQYFVFNNVQTLLNIRLFARLSLHGEAMQAHDAAVIVDFTPSPAYERGRGRMRKKSPTLAAALSLFFGPLGYLYIGWRYAVVAVGAFAVVGTVVAVAGFDVPPWMKYVILPVLAWKAFTICSVANAMIEADDDNANALNSFPVAAMAMSDLVVAFGMISAASVGLYVSGVLLLQRSIIKGLLVLFVGTPALVWIATVAFGLIADAIDAAFARGADNVFRR
jgi:hypothetical protein